MKRSALRLFAVLLLGGCSVPATETELAKDESTARGTETSSTQSVAGESLSDAPDAASSGDAERLLASALQSAKADDKRVMVHLGAPW